MREATLGEIYLAIGQFHFYRRLVLFVVFNLRCSKHDINVIMPMDVRQRGRVRRQFHLEHPRISILQNQMVARLGSDFDWAGLGQESQTEQENWENVSCHGTKL